MCWAGPKAQHLAKPSPGSGPEVGFGWASNARKPKAQALKPLDASVVESHQYIHWVRNG